MHGAAGLQQFPAGADVGSAFPVPVEIRTGEDAVLPIALLPHRDVRDDFFLLDQPAEELARPIGYARGEPPRPQIEALFYSIQHRLCRGNFIVGASRRCLDIYDYCILDVDEVVQPISELHALVGLGCPCRLRVRRRGHLGRLALITALSLLSDPPLSFKASPSIAASASSAARYSATARFCRCFSVQSSSSGALPCNGSRSPP